MGARLDHSPNASLRRIGTSTRAAVDRIVCAYLEATPEQVREGAEWYREARECAEDLAVAGGISTPRAAAVISHLSPRTTWGRNVSGAWGLVISGHAPHCLGANVKRARRALRASDPLATIQGPKTRRFAANILGDMDAVTVDVWAARVALGLRDDAEACLARVGVYDAVEHAHRLAGRRLGVPPAHVQATCWIVIRGTSSWEAFDPDGREEHELARVLAEADAEAWS